MGSGGERIEQFGGDVGRRPQDRVLLACVEPARQRTSDGFDHPYVRDVSIPRLNSVSPPSAGRGTSFPSLFVRGSGLRGPLTIIISDVGAIGNALSLVDGSQAAGSGLAVPAGAAPGRHDVWVLQGSSSALCPGCFTVT